LYPHPFGAAADQPPPQQPDRRRADDAEQRDTVGHQRDVHGELAAAGEELLGSVERIDQEEAAAERRDHVVRPLFRQRRDFGDQLLQPVGDDAVSGKVGFGDRGSVALALDLYRIAVDRDDRKPGLHHQIGERPHQVRRRGAVDCAHRITHRFVSSPFRMAVFRRPCYHLSLFASRGNRWQFAAPQCI
jgi:hypothetical protein